MSNENNTNPFGKKNYQFMIIGVLVLTLGYIVMKMDTEEYGFGIVGLTIGPVILVIGFIIEIFAIMHKPKDS